MLWDAILLGIQCPPNPRFALQHSAGKSVLSKLLKFDVTFKQNL